MSEFSKRLTSELDVMWRFALRLTSNQADAEDLVQRTCVIALEKQSTYHEQGRLRSWLFRIEHRVWLNVLRARQIRHAGSFKHETLKTAVSYEAASDSYAITHSDTSTSATQNELSNAQSPESQLQLHQIFEQVECLPEAQRLVVMLVCVEGFTYQESAQVLDIPIGTVMSRLARARITLGKAMLQSSSIKKTAGVPR